MENNDTFRKELKPMSEEQKTQMLDVKLAAENLLDLINQVAPAEERSERSRCLQIARTNLEQTIMWAVKGITA